MADIIFAKLDASGLSAAITEARKWNKRAPAVAANTAAFFVMRGWVRSVKKVSVATVDTELGVATVLQPKARGAGFKTAKRSQRLTGGRSGAVVKSVPLAVLVVLARANKAGLKRGAGTGKISNYNVRTNSRYALARVPSRDEMPGYISRMIKSRHSATAFLASAGIPVIRRLESAIDSKYRRGAPPMDLQAQGAARRARVPKGEVMPAVESETVATCVVALLIGTTGRNAENLNRALHEIGGPELQRQLVAEAEATARKVATWQARELQQKLRQRGAITV